MKLGKLDFIDVHEREDLIAEPVAKAIKQCHLTDVLVTAIDPDLADTAAFCEHYQISMDISANCVILEARRAERTWYVACMVLATTRANVNGVIRRHLDARKISFATMDQAVDLSGMEYGGITPIGLPNEWPILVDERVAAKKHVIIGSGLRTSKLLIPGTIFSKLPQVYILDLAKNS